MSTAHIHRQRAIRKIVLLTFLLILSACNLFQPAEEPEQIGPYTSETLAFLSTQSALGQTPTLPEPATESSSPAQQPSSTTQLETIPSPTLTQSPTQAVQQDNTSVVQPTPITFKPGGTSAYIEQPISAGEVHHYSVQAAAGQMLIVGAASPNQDVYLEISGLETGEQMLSADARQVDFFGILPAAQAYQITLRTTNPDTYYFLGVEIPANIVFVPGEETIKVEGYIAMHSEWYPDLMTRVRYYIPPIPGQEITSIRLASPNIADLSLGIIGAGDGQPYKRYEVSGVEFSGSLPLNQGYYIGVYSLGVSTEFTLEIRID